MLKKARNELIPATLTVTGQGESITLDITYYNRKQSEVMESIRKAHDEDGNGVIDTLLFVVKEWEAEYPLTVEGLKDAEDDRPGLLLAVMQGFHDARSVAKQKN